MAAMHIGKWWPAVAVLCLVWACEQATEPLVWPGANVVLISIDTLRADRLGCYGYPRATSPRLDALAQRAWIFVDAYTHSPNTIVAHASLLTSLYPQTHGVRPDVSLTEEHVTLAERFRAAGYKTAGFTAHGDWLNRKMGFAQGFQRFASGYRSAAEVNLRALEWIETLEDGGQPFFLFVHYYDVHSDWGELPYETKTSFDFKFLPDPRPSVTGCRHGSCGSELLKEVNLGEARLDLQEVDYFARLYDGGIAYTDQKVGELLDALEAIGVFESSWIAITADHGEEFLEHGRMLHEQPYEEVARVPLLIKPPHVEVSRSISGVVGLVDLMPTLLEGVGIEAGEVQGESLLSRLSHGAWLRSWLGSEKVVYFNDDNELSDISLRTERFALVTRHGFTRLELYDRRGDRLNQHDLAERRQGEAQRLLSLAREFDSRQRAAATAVEGRVEIDEATAERLGRLGYLE